jgi:hypothetical protein
MMHAISSPSNVAESGVRLPRTSIEWTTPCVFGSTKPPLLTAAETVAFITAAPATPVSSSVYEKVWVAKAPFGPSYLVESPSSM